MVKWPDMVSRLVVSSEDSGVFQGEEAWRSDFDPFLPAREGLVSFRFLRSSLRFSVLCNVIKVSFRSQLYFLRVVYPFGREFTVH